MCAALRSSARSRASSPPPLALWWWSSLHQPASNHETTVEIPRGASTTEVLRQLAAADLLPSALSGRLYFEVMHRGRTPHWGSYRFQPESRPVDVLEAVLEGQVETFALTIREGTTAAEIGEQLLSLGFPGAYDWNSIVDDTAWIRDLAPNARTLDGFLFPDTYRFASETDVRTVARTLVNRFRQVWAEESRTNTPFLESVLDTITLASLVEAETAVPEERARVAGVFTNRLARGMLLQCDPTVVFALQRRGEWTGRLLRVHWEVDDPYNTYRYPGCLRARSTIPGGRRSLQRVAQKGTRSCILSLNRAVVTLSPELSKNTIERSRRCAALGIDRRPARVVG